MVSDEVKVEVVRCDDLDKPLLLDSHVEQTIIFKVIASNIGTLEFTGIKYNLSTPDVENSEIIQTKQLFQIRGPRLSSKPQAIEYKIPTN